MSALRFLALSSILLATACGGARYRAETVGSARAVLATPAPAVASVPVSGPDPYRVELRVELPRAVEVSYVIECPGGTSRGVVGEPWEHYRQRRLAELERERQQKVGAAAALVGAVVGQADARAEAHGPGAHGEVAVGVDGRAVGAAVADGAMADAALPPGDVGARIETREVDVGPGDGACTLRLASDIPGQDLRGVVGVLEVERLVDVARENRENRARQREIAVGARAEVVASLAATGADPARQARLRAEAEAAAAAEAARRAQLRAEAEAASRAEAAAEAARRAQLRAEAEAASRAEAAAEAARRAQLRAEAEAEAAAAAELERQRVALALRARGEIVAYFGACGGDPYRRQRERAALAAERQRQAQLELDARLKLEAQARLKLEARLELEAQARVEAEARARAEAERQRQALGHALAARERIVATLIGLGADPDYRRRQNEAELREFEARMRARREADLSRRLAAGAEVEVSVEAPATTVVEVSAPPMPAAPIEEPPPRPAADAVWVAGSFELSGGSWLWRAGHWTVPPASGAIWVPAVEVVIGGSRVLRPGSWRDQRGHRVRQGSRRRVRDHRRR